MDDDDLEELKKQYRKETNPTEDWHHTEEWLTTTRETIAKADPAWLKAWDAEVLAWNADFDGDDAEPDDPR